MILRIIKIENITLVKTFNKWNKMLKEKVMF